MALTQHPVVAPELSTDANVKLGRIQSVLNNAVAALDGLGSKTYAEVIQHAPDLAEPVPLVVNYATDKADEATAAILEGVLSVAARNKDLASSEAFQSFQEGLDNYWVYDADQRGFVKSKGGGIDYIAKAAAASPELQSAIESSIMRLGILRLYDDLTEAQKVVVWIAGLGVASPQLVGQLYSQKKIDGVLTHTLSLPRVGSVQIADGKLQNLSASIRRDLARVGVRDRPLQATVSTRLLQTSGDNAIRAGVVVPVARAGVVSAGAGATWAPGDKRIQVSPELSYSAPLGKASPWTAKATVGMPVAVSSRGQIEVEPQGHPEFFVELSAKKFPSLNKRLRQQHAPGYAERANRDRLAVAILRQNKVDADGQPYVYTSLIKKEPAELEKILSEPLPGSTNLGKTERPLIAWLAPSNRGL